MTAVIAVLVAGLCWYASRHWRAECRERRQAEWDAYIDQALALTDTPIYDELAIARLRADLDTWNEQTR